MRKIGLIINPIAGMGGRVGLKGTDNMVDYAMQLGAYPTAPLKALRALLKFETDKNSVLILTGADELGARIADEAGFKTSIIHIPLQKITQPMDTILLARKLVEAGVELILFAGGDGTARNLVEACISDIPVVGIPAGVKIYSSVFATCPEKAGEIASRYLKVPSCKSCHENEVLDINEEDYRHDLVTTNLYGYLMVPSDRKFMQNKKSPSPLSEANAQREIALEVKSLMEKDTMYFIGPGSTTRAVLQLIDQPCTLLGVDIVLNEKVVCSDASESVLLNMMDKYNCKVIITPTGGQGFLLGRGNQQFSPEVLKRVGFENLIVIATIEKLAELRHRPLLIDTGDYAVDQIFKGYIKVITGIKTCTIYPVNL